MISAAITPGTQPSKVRISTIKMDPQPLSYTANGGNSIDRITLQTLINGLPFHIKPQRYQLKFAENYHQLFFVNPVKLKLTSYVNVIIFATSYP